MLNGNPIPYGHITEVRYIRDRLLFPISWLHKQDYCEYQIYLENIKGIKAQPTRAMMEGKQQHAELYDQFAKEATPTTFDEMLNQSKVVKVYSREFSVTDVEHGIFGFIDAVLLTPDEFVVIDDKPGRKAYLSSIHQVYGYCLAFKQTVKVKDNRDFVAALRERGTDNIYWKSPFDQIAETEITSLISHIHNLLSGAEEFGSAENPNKCQACRYNSVCRKSLI
jgi:CRISPR/Cas system-associated exonuclease Cas4 (RecB family)